MKWCRSVVHVVPKKCRVVSKLSYFGTNFTLFQLNMISLRYHLKNALQVALTPQTLTLQTIIGTKSNLFLLAPCQRMFLVWTQCHISFQNSLLPGFSSKSSRLLRKISNYSATFVNPFEGLGSEFSKFLSFQAISRFSTNCCINCM